MNPSAPNPDSGLRGLLKRLKPHAVPLIILFLLWLTIAIANTPGTGQWLTGWDNLHPEFNLPLNLERALVGVWQEFQGLGLVGGHGYSATIPHTIFVSILSLFLPVNMARTGVIFFMLFVGSVGTYALAIAFLSRVNHATRADNRWSALVAGVFAILNLATIQNFYIPLEAFVIQFAMLPWLILSLWRLMEKPARGSFFLFLLINIATAPIGFIPPLFVVAMLIVGITIFSWFILQPNRTRFLLGIKIITGVTCIHAFWLIPVAYFSFTHQSSYLWAYNNLSSTEHFIHMNQKYGTLEHLPILRSFLFESLDVTQSGGTTPIFAPWISHLQNPWITSIGYGFFVLMVFGWLVALARAQKSYSALSAALLAFILFSLLATDIPPFSWISLFLQKASPTFFQSFRIAFTKLSLAYALMVSLLIGLGLERIFAWIKRPVWHILGAGITILLLVLFSIPAFRGHFLYDRTRQAIPSAYFNLFTFFNQSPTQGRILNLPQGWNWGWTPYAWGYSGSGFLWYGIENPIMDRAFDVWSAQNENYYWELVYALYSKQYNVFETLIRKYEVEWVLFDPSVVPYQQPRAIFSTVDVASYLTTTPSLNLVQIFEHLKLYQVKAKPSVSFVSLETDLPNILPPYRWSENDTAYQQHGPYISDPTGTPDVWYPFRSFFTKRRASEKEFMVEKTSDGYLFTGKLPPTNQPFSLSAPVYSDTEQYVPGIISTKRTDGQLTIQAFASYPSMTGSMVRVALASPINISLPRKSTALNLTINGEERKTVALPATDGEEDVVKTTLLTHRPNTIDVADDRGKIIQTLRASVPREPSMLNQSTQPIGITIPTGTDQQSYDSDTDETFFNHQSHDCINPSPLPQKVGNDETGRFLIFSSDHEEKQCFDIILPKLPHQNGYLVEIQAKNLTGKPLTFVAINSQTRKNDMEVSFPKTKTEMTSFFIIPPMQTDGLGYALKFLNETEYGESAINNLYSLRVTPIPYRWLTQLTMTREKSPELTQTQDRALNVDHPNPAYYKVSMSQSVNTPHDQTLILSQSFDPGWTAWERIPTFPYVRQLPDHVLVNNWANGWHLEAKQNESIAKQAERGDTFDLSYSSCSSCSTIVLFFWPQLLQWLGFALLPIPFLIGILRKT